MDTSTNYFVKAHSRIQKEDLPNLPEKLQKDFETFKKVLAVDPENRRGLDGHDLTRELTGCKTIDVIYLEEHYRLVYKIDNDPERMRVNILSFDRHDSAYDKAKNRELGRN